MYTTAIKLIIRPLSLILPLSLCGCILTDDYKQSLKDKHELTEIQQQIEQLEEVYTLQQVSRKVQALEQLRPDINRIIEMENDLAYLTNILENSEAMNNNGTIDGPSLPSIETVVSESSFLNDQNSQNSLPNFEADNSSVVVNAVAPIMISSDAGIYDIEDSAIDAKFSSSINDTDSQFMSANQKPLDKFSSVSNSDDNQMIDSKFSNSGSLVANQSFASNQYTQSSPQDIVAKVEQANIDSCFISGSVDSQYSVHLASYSTESSAKKGWQLLSEKHKGLLCNLSAKVTDVSVNGKQFLSLRVGPLANQQSVKQLCSAIKATGDYCASAEYSGRNL